MSTHKRIDAICIVVIVCGLILTILFMNSESLGIQKIVDEDAPKYEGTEYFTSNDLNGNYDEDKAQAVITLEGDSISVKGNGAYVLNGDVYITGGGAYVLTGTLTDGRIIVDAYNSSKIWLILKGADISCSDDAAIIVEQAEKVFLTLAEGTDNAVTCADTYSDEAVEAGHTGAIFARDDLTINGSGSLTVDAGYQHGIVSKDDLVITGGHITVTAAGDALNANKNLCITDAWMDLAAGDDGIHSDTMIYVASGTILISQCYEGLEALTIEIAGGDITIYPTDDGINANAATGNAFGTGGGPGRGGWQRNGESPAGESNGEEMTGESAKGLRGESNGEEMTGESAEGLRGESNGEEMTGESAVQENEDTADEESWIRISGGTVTIINESGTDADGLDSNGDVFITGGTILVSVNGDGMNNAIDYGSESGGICEISGGTVVAAGGSSMAESFSETSTQCSLLYICSSLVDSGTTVSVTNEEGTVILSWEVPCSFSSVQLSSPDMKQGETYTVKIGDEETSITLEDTSSIYGTTGGFAGPGGFAPHGRNTTSE